MNQWRLTGISLPPAGWLRATGRTANGISTGLIEHVARFPADALAPDTSIVAGPLGAVQSNIATFGFACTEPALRFNYSLDGAPPVQSATDTITLGPLTQGFHELRVFATDFAGNDDPNPATRTWVVDIGTPVPGAMDPTFVHAAAPPFISGGNVQRLAVQPDGKILAAGSFSTVEGEFRRYLARFLPGGALESSATFDIGDGALNFINAMLVQPDGKIVICGAFTAFNSQQRLRIARLHENGAVESNATFNIGTGANSVINAAILRPDGKIIIGGQFSTFNGQPRASLARLNPDGTLDPAWQPSVDGPILCLALQPDGKIVLGGVFNNVNGQPRNGVARLNADGTLDTGFVAPFAFCYPGVLAIQPDGKILVAGYLLDTSFNAKGLARLRADGSLDPVPAFEPNGAFSSIQDIALQADGKIIIAGEFTSAAGQPRGGIARLHADGTLESTATFNTGPGAANGAASASVNSVALQLDGKILVGGNFTSFGGGACTHLARLINDTATSSLSISGQYGAHWYLGGSAPELANVRFEVNTGGGWTDLGPGIRTGTGWDITGLALPASGILRATGRVGAQPGNSHFIAQTRVLAAPVDLWRQDNFGADATNPAIAGNLADPDADGSVNLIEYANGTDPRHHDGRPPIGVAFEGAAVSFTYQRAVAANDVTYGVQTSPDAVNWFDTTNYTEEILANNGVTERVKVNVPFDAANLTAEKGFIRGKVSMP